MVASVALSSIYIIMFGFYSYAFFVGGLLRWSPEEWTLNGDHAYTGGELIGIIFSVLTATFQVTSIGPMVKAITEAKIGGKLAYDVID